MASNIDPLQPEQGFTLTADTRANFSAAKDEIEVLQAKDTSLDSDIAGKEDANANIQQHIAKVAAENPHGTTKASVGLGNADNTSDLSKPVSTATQTALDGKKDDFTENTGFNKALGTIAGTVSEGNHSHTYDEVGAAPIAHVGDSSHLSSDERDGMTTAAPSAADPLITQADLDVHSSNQALHITPTQNDALDGAATPSATNVFATMDDVSGGGATTFTGLTDTPASYVGEQGALVKVNATEDGLIFGAASGTTVAWGDITGTLASQTDLQGELDDKLDATDSVFPTYAMFDEEFSATAPAFDAANGNKQTMTLGSGSTVTLTAPASKAGSFILTVTDGANISGFSPTVEWDSGTIPTFTGKCVIALYTNGTDWTGSAMTGVA